MVTVISIMLIGTVAWQPQARAEASGLPPMTLTVEALNGTQIVLHESDIGSLPSYQAYGGLRTMGGSLMNLGNYTGVPVTTFLDMVDDEPSTIGYGFSVTVIAPDYSQTLSYEACVNGSGLNTYDNVTGDPVQATLPLTPMVAYYYNDQNLSSSSGPLELAIVGPEGLCTDGKLWVTNVTRLEVHPNLPPMNLMLTGPNGTQTINETEISNLPAIRAYGGLVSGVGIPSDLGNYTGVPLTTLCDLVGGLANGSSVLVTALDNYSITLSYSQLNGNWTGTTYSQSTGQQVNQTQPLTPIIAYYYNDANLSSDMAPLQLAIVGPEGLLTVGKYWVHYVDSLQIQSVTVPEFLTPSLILAFTIATMIATIMSVILRKNLEHTPQKGSRSTTTTDVQG
jgi:hypothetical protein